MSSDDWQQWNRPLPPQGRRRHWRALREACARRRCVRSPTRASEIVGDLGPQEAALDGASARAARWVEAARADKRARPLVEQMLEQFPLDSAQGKALMGLAEALLRTPDPKRADQLIAERLATVRAAGVPGNTALLLRTGVRCCSAAAGRLLPDVAGELAGDFTAGGPRRAGGRAGGARGAAPVDADDGARVHRRRDDRERAGARQDRAEPRAVLLRRAGRGRAHRGGCAALLSTPTRTRSRCWARQPRGDSARAARGSR